MLTLLIVVGALIALVVLALVFLPSFVDNDAIIALAQEQVRTATGGELVVAGDTEFSLFPELKLALGGTTLTLPPQTQGDPSTVGKIETIDIGLSFSSLLSGANEVGDITLNNGELNAVDSAGTSITQVVIHSVTVSGLNIANSPIKLDGGITVPGQNGSPDMDISLEGQIRVPADLAQITIDSLATQVDGALTTPVTAQLSGTVELSPVLAKLDLGAGTAAGDINGTLTYGDELSPQIDLALSSKRLELDNLIPAGMPATPSETATTRAADNSGSGGGNGSAGKNTGTQEASATGSDLPSAALPIGALAGLDVRVDLSADALISAGQEITDAKLLLVVKDEVANIKALQGTLHKGTLDTRARVDMRKAPVKASVEGGLKGFDVDSLLTSVGSGGAVLGQINASWDVDTQGETTDDLVRNLDGDAKVFGSNIEVTSISIGATMCKAVALANRQSTQNALPATTQVDQLSAGIIFAAGKATLDDVAVSTPGVKLSGTGDAALDTLDFKARLVARLFKSLGDLDPACAVKDSYTSIDWPVNCKGSLGGGAEPQCNVDAEAIIKQTIKADTTDKIKEQGGKLLKKLFGN